MVLPLARFEGPLRGGEQREKGKEGRGKEGKERDMRKTSP